MSTSSIKPKATTTIKKTAVVEQKKKPATPTKAAIGAEKSIIEQKKKSTTTTKEQDQDEEKPEKEKKKRAAPSKPKKEIAQVDDDAKTVKTKSKSKSKSKDDVEEDSIKEVVIAPKTTQNKKLSSFTLLPNVLFQYDFSPENTYMICSLFESIKLVLGDSFNIQFVAAEPVINVRVSSISSSKRKGAMNITSLKLAAEDVFEMDSIVLPKKDKVLHVTTNYFLGCLNDKSKKRSMTWVYRLMDKEREEREGKLQDEEVKEGEVTEKKEDINDHITNPYPFTFYFNRDKPGNTREFSLALNVTGDFVDDVYTLDPGDMYIAQARVSTRAFHAILKDLHIKSASANKKSIDDEEKWCQLDITKEYLKVSTYHVPGSGGSSVHKQITCRHNDRDIDGDDEYSTCIEIFDCKPPIFTLIFETKSLILFVLEKLPNVTHFDMTVLDCGLLNKYQIGKHSHLAFLIPAKDEVE